MPRDVGRNARQKFRQPPQLVVRVVEAGNHKGDDLNPQAHLVQATNGLQDRLDAPAELAIVAGIQNPSGEPLEGDPPAGALERPRGGGPAWDRTRPEPPAA